MSLRQKFTARTGNGDQIKRAEPVRPPVPYDLRTSGWLSPDGRFWAKGKFETHHQWWQEAVGWDTEKDGWVRIVPGSWTVYDAALSPQQTQVLEDAVSSDHGRIIYVYFGDDSPEPGAVIRGGDWAQSGLSFSDYLGGGWRSVVAAKKMAGANGDPVDRDLVESIAEQVRGSIVKCEESDGLCSDLTSVLCSRLTQIGVPCGQVTGWFRADRPIELPESRAEEGGPFTDGAPHSWAVVGNDLIVDVTADQFNQWLDQPMPPVFVGHSDRYTMDFVEDPEVLDPEWERSMLKGRGLVEGRANGMSINAQKLVDLGRARLDQRQVRVQVPEDLIVRYSRLVQRMVQMSDRGQNVDQLEERRRDLHDDLADAALAILIPDEDEREQNDDLWNEVKDLVEAHVHTLVKGDWQRSAGAGNDVSIKRAWAARRKKQAPSNPDNLKEEQAPGTWTKGDSGMLAPSGNYYSLWAGGHSLHVDWIEEFLAGDDSGWGRILVTDSSALVVDLRRNDEPTPEQWTWMEDTIFKLDAGLTITIETTAYFHFTVSDFTKSGMTLQDFVESQGKRGRLAARWARRKRNPAYEKETEEIVERAKRPENQKRHKFEAAEWTHKNGHPRCSRCGDEEPVGGQCNPALHEAAGKSTPEQDLQILFSDLKIAALYKRFQEHGYSLAPLGGGQFKILGPDGGSSTASLAKVRNFFLNVFPQLLNQPSAPTSPSYEEGFKWGRKYVDGWSYSDIFNSDPREELETITQISVPCAEGDEGAVPSEYEGDEGSLVKGWIRPWPGGVAYQAAEDKEAFERGWFDGWRAGQDQTFNEPPKDAGLRGRWMARRAERESYIGTEWTLKEEVRVWGRAAKSQDDRVPSIVLPVGLRITIVSEPQRLPHGGRPEVVWVKWEDHPQTGSGAGVARYDDLHYGAVYQGRKHTGLFGVMDLMQETVVSEHETRAEAEAAAQKLNEEADVVMAYSVVLIDPLGAGEKPGTMSTTDVPVADPNVEFDKLIKLRDQGKLTPEQFSEKSKRLFGSVHDRWTLRRADHRSDVCRHCDQPAIAKVSTGVRKPDGRMEYESLCLEHYRQRASIFRQNSVRGRWAMRRAQIEDQPEQTIEQKVQALLYEIAHDNEVAGYVPDPEDLEREVTNFVADERGVDAESIDPQWIRQMIAKMEYPGWRAYPDPKPELPPGIKLNSVHERWTLRRAKKIDWDLVRSMAQQVRGECVAETGKPSRDRCVEINQMLARALRSVYGDAVALRYGPFTDDRGGEFHHWWVELGGRVIDAAADQFNPGIIEQPWPRGNRPMPDIYIGPRSPRYRAESFYSGDEIDQRFAAKKPPEHGRTCNHPWPGKKPGEVGWCGRCGLGKKDAGQNPNTVPEGEWLFEPWQITEPRFINSYIGPSGKFFPMVNDQGTPISHEDFVPDGWPNSRLIGEGWIRVVAEADGRLIIDLDRAPTSAQAQTLETLFFLSPARDMTVGLGSDVDWADFSTFDKITESDLQGGSLADKLTELFSRTKVQGFVMRQKLEDERQSEASVHGRWTRRRAQKSEQKLLRELVCTAIGSDSGTMNEAVLPKGTVVGVQPWSNDHTIFFYSPTYSRIIVRGRVMKSNQYSASVQDFRAATDIGHGEGTGYEHGPECFCDECMAIDDMSTRRCPSCGSRECPGDGHSIDCRKPGTMTMDQVPVESPDSLLDRFNRGEIDEQELSRRLKQISSVFGRWMRRRAAESFPDLGDLLSKSQNMFGALKPEIRKRIISYLTSPTTDTWDDVQSILVKMSPMTSLWQAVLTVDPQMPKTGRVTDSDGNMKEDWSYIPSPQIVVSALRSVLNAPPEDEADDEGRFPGRKPGWASIRSRWRLRQAAADDYRARQLSNGMWVVEERRSPSEPWGIVTLPHWPVEFKTQDEAFDALERLILPSGVPPWVDPGCPKCGKKSGTVDFMPKNLALCRQCQQVYSYSWDRLRQDAPPEINIDEGLEQRTEPMDVPVMTDRQRQERIDALLDRLQQTTLEEEKRSIEQRIRSLRAGLRSRWQDRRAEGERPKALALQIMDWLDQIGPEHGLKDGVALDILAARGFAKLVLEKFGPGSTDKDRMEIMRLWESRRRRQGRSPGPMKEDLTVPGGMSDWVTGKPIPRPESKLYPDLHEGSLIKLESGQDVRIKGILKDLGGQPEMYVAEYVGGSRDGQEVALSHDFKLLGTFLGQRRADGSSPIDIFDQTQTGMAWYDNLLQNPDYFRTAKGVSGQITMMSPDEYLDQCARMQGTSDARQRQIISPEALAKIKKVVSKGQKLHMPVLDWSDKLQEGRHRAALAKALGLAQIPVLVVTNVEEREASAKTKPKRQKGIKGHEEFGGLALDIEFRPGDQKKCDDGNVVTYVDSYGEIKGTQCIADGMAVDIYLSSNPVQEAPVFVVHQLKKDKVYDEDKVMLGFADEAAAKACYEQHGPPWGFGSIEELTWDQFANGYLAAQRAPEDMGAKKLPEIKAEYHFRPGQSMVTIAPLLVWTYPDDATSRRQHLFRLPTGIRVTIDRAVSNGPDQVAYWLHTDQPVGHQGQTQFGTTGGPLSSALPLGDPRKEPSEDFDLPRTMAPGEKGQAIDRLLDQWTGSPEKRKQIEERMRSLGSAIRGWFARRADSPRVTSQAPTQVRAWLSPDGTFFPVPKNSTHAGIAHAVGGKDQVALQQAGWIRVSVIYGGVIFDLGQRPTSAQAAVIEDLGYSGPGRRLEFDIMYPAPGGPQYPVIDLDQIGDQPLAEALSKAFDGKWRGAVRDHWSMRRRGADRCASFVQPVR